MAQIRILKDNDKNTVYPQSVTQAIVDANGVNLDTILHNTVMTDAEEEVADIIVGYEDINNKVTEITEDSTDVQYPSAKAVHNAILDTAYTKDEANGNFATKDKYGDAAISLGRRTDTGSVGTNSVAIGDRTQANGNYSVAMGSLAQANAMAAVALGREVRANGSYAVALGEGAIAKNTGEVATGRWNIEDTTGKVLHSVGNGTSSSARSNAYTIDNEGNAWFAGDIYVGSSSGTHKDEGSIKLPTISDAKSVSDLVGKYNIPTVEYAVNHGDLLAGTWTESDSGTLWTKDNMSISLSVTASTATITNMNNAFDNSDSTYALLKKTGSAGEIARGYLYIDMGEAVHSYWARYAESYSSYGCNFILSASEDNATWVQMGDMSVPGDGIAWKTANTDDYYRYYRIEWSEQHSNGLGLLTLKLDKSYKEETLNYDTLFLNNQLENYENGLRCMIEIPADFAQQGVAVYLNINNLGKKLINGTIEANKKYELVYDGTVFNATEVTL